MVDAIYSGADLRTGQALRVYSRGVIYPSHYARIYPVKPNTTKCSAATRKEQRQKISDNMIVMGYNDRRI